MKRVSRGIKRHFGATARNVAVRSQRPWYWRLLLAALLVLLGYLLAYWQIVGGGLDAQSLQSLRQENSDLHASMVRIQRQLQVERAAQATLAKEIDSLQGESMRLKEDVAFYKNILSDSSAAGELKFYSFRLSKGERPNEYDYHILLAQSGRNNKPVQGQLQFTLNSAQGNAVALRPLADGGSAASTVKVNFKYYQRLDGSLIVPDAAAGASVEASFIENGARRATISHKVDLPV